ncbi:MAG: HDIG domain-containing protein [Spirochaetaceae bacterium]|jgi:putative nucleotidyltransferase with HDIG domain|nr:HDIG domain-containing protein [Spirochaetaceae bacterium]
MTRNEAWALLKKHNQDSFHLQHALTVEAVMRYFAREEGFADDEEFWGNVGLLHDIDFEEFPEEHCVRAVEMLKEGGADDKLIHAVTSHGYGLTGTTAKPEHQMEKILFAADELTGLIWSASLVRPSKSTKDMEVKSVKKKFKTPAFAAGCNRDVIEQGAANLGWDLDSLIGKTLKAMQETEDGIAKSLAGK